jgi:hypothetical protein
VLVKYSMLQLCAKIPIGNYELSFLLMLHLFPPYPVMMSFAHLIGKNHINLLLQFLLNIRVSSQ